MIYERMVTGLYNAMTIRCWVGCELVRDPNGSTVTHLEPHHDVADNVLHQVLCEAESKLISTPDGLAIFIAEETGWTVEVLRPNKTGVVVYATWP